METYELDPDVTRWDLHLLDVCTLKNNGCCSTITQYDQDLSQVDYVREGFSENANVENDEAVARARNFRESILLKLLDYLMLGKHICKRLFWHKIGSVLQKDNTVLGMKMILKQEIILAERWRMQIPAKAYYRRLMVTEKLEMI